MFQNYVSRVVTFLLEELLEYSIMYGLIQIVKNACENFVDGGHIYKKEDTGYARDVFTGVRWQCVEYGRRYLVVTQGATFGDVHGAINIFDLKEA